MNKRQRKKLAKKIGNFIAPWEIMNYEPIMAMTGGQAIKAEYKDELTYKSLPRRLMRIGF